MKEMLESGKLGKKDWHSAGNSRVLITFYTELGNDHFLLPPHWSIPLRKSTTGYQLDFS